MRHASQPLLDRQPADPRSKAQATTRTVQERHLARARLRIVSTHHHSPRLPRRGYGPLPRRSAPPVGRRAEAETRTSDSRSSAHHHPRRQSDDRSPVRATRVAIVVPDPVANAAPRAQCRAQQFIRIQPSPPRWPAGGWRRVREAVHSPAPRRPVDARDCVRRMRPGQGDDFGGALAVCISTLDDQHCA